MSAYPEPPVVDLPDDEWTFPYYSIPAREQPDGQWDTAYLLVWYSLHPDRHGDPDYLVALDEWGHDWTQFLWAQDTERMENARLDLMDAADERATEADL